MSIVASVVDTLAEMFPQGAALHEPRFAGNEQRYVDEAIRSTFVSSVGAFVDRFEAELAHATGAKRAVAIANGTSALHACLHLVGVSVGDEVLVPALTFVATANAVLLTGATPHFIDVEARSFGVDATKLAEHLQRIAEKRDDGCYNLQTGRRIRAVVPMHAFGHPVDMDALRAVADRYAIIVVEDAAESLGSVYKGVHTGRHGRIAAVSFNGNKIVTSGGGGAILTDDEALGTLAKHVTTTAKISHPWEFVHDQMGFNYRMPNLNAALACGQLEQLPIFLEKKRRLAQRYVEAFAQVEGVQVMREPDYGRSNYWLNVLLLGTEHAAERDAILAAAHQRKIQARPVWKLMHRLPFLQGSPRADLTVAEDLERRAICVPSSSFL